MTRKTPEQKPVFFDSSGKRHRVVDFVMLFFIAIIALGAAFTIYYLHRVATIEHNAKSSQYQPQKSTTTVLYTEAHTKAYSVLGDRMQHIDRVLLPKYLVTEEGITTPINYTKLSQSLEAQSKNIATTYDKYYVLSSQDFSRTPVERSYNPSVDIFRPDFIQEGQVEDIVDDATNTGGKGIYINLNLSRISNAETTQKYIDLLRSVKKQLHDSDLELGLILDLAELNSANSSLLREADTVYFGQSKHTPAEQLAMVTRYVTPAKDIEFTFELPTVSTKHDSRDTVQSTIDVSYQSMLSHIEGREITDRTTQPVTLSSGTDTYSMYDAVSAYNYMTLLDAKLESTTKRTYALADPGYEEYTVWNLLSHNPRDKVVPSIVADDAISGLEIREQGEGQIYSLAHAAVPGKRTIEFGADSTIISSTLTAAEKPSVVTKQGSKAKKIALTFDDGPHPISTPKVLDILDSYGVKGAFFVIGQNVLSYPNTAREIVNRGHEIENHSYTHPIYSLLTPEANRSQLQATNDVIKEVTGATPHYFRKPYSDHSQIVNGSDIVYLKMLSELGLKANEYDIDSKDWLLDSSDEIVARVKNLIEASDGHYSQILLHDAHHTPELTLEALPQIIEYLRDENIEIVPLSALADTTTSGGAHEPSSVYQALEIKSNLLTILALIVIMFVLLSFMRYGWMLVGAIFYRVKYGVTRSFVKNMNLYRSQLPKVAVVIACYNEEKVIGKTIEALQQNTYRNFRLIIVNDGSTDATAKIIRGYAAADKRIKFIDAPNGGKAVALQRAMATTTYRWIVFCDADTIFAPTALERFAMTAMLDTHLGAVAGTILVGNDNNALTRSQVIEYGIAHQFIKAAQDVTNMITVVPGAAGMWHRPTLKKVGGFLSDTLAEDADATMRIIAKGSRVKYESSVAAYTEVPEDIKLLFKQRTRWQLGNMQSIFKHRKGLFNLRYGTLGIAGLPLFYLDLISAVIFPFIFIYTTLALVLQSDGAIATVQAVVRDPSINYAIFLGLVLLLVELLLVIFVIVTARKSPAAKLKLLLTVPYYMTVYKALLSVFTLVALVRAFRGQKHGWGHLARSATAKM